MLIEEGIKLLHTFSFLLNKTGFHVLKQAGVLSTETLQLFLESGKNLQQRQAQTGAK